MVVRLLVGLVLPCLGSLEEFNSCLAEVWSLGKLRFLGDKGSFQVAIVLPHSCVEEITRAVDELLSGVQESEVEAKCELEILMEGEVEKMGEVVEKRWEQVEKGGEKLD